MILQVFQNRGMHLIEQFAPPLSLFFATTPLLRRSDHNLHSLPQLVMKQIAFLIALVAVLALCSAPVAAKPTEIQSTEGFVCDGSSLHLFAPPASCLHLCPIIVSPFVFV